MAKKWKKEKVNLNIVSFGEVDVNADPLKESYRNSEWKRWHSFIKMQ